MHYIVEFIWQVIGDVVLYGIGRAVCGLCGYAPSPSGMREEIVGALALVTVFVGAWLLFR